MMSEVKLERKRYFDAVISGRLLGKQVSNAECKEFIKSLQRMWNKCGRRTEKMMDKYGSWLEGDIVIADAESDVESVVEDDGDVEEDGRQSSASGGRPTTPYEHLSSRSKRRSSRDLSQSQPTQKLVHAATQGARAEKSHDLAFVLKEAAASPGRPSKMRRTLRETHSRPQVESLSPDRALALTVSLDLTQRGYQIMRNTSKDAAKSHIYPTYIDILSAKERCYPSPSAISVTDVKASVTLQGLLDHTTARLAQSQDILSQLDLPADQPGPSSPAPVHGLLDAKWGFDGATDQSVYKQSLREEDRPAEQSLFCTTMVPLRLQLDGEELWRNKTPSSTRFCRPLCLQYTRETPELSRAERQRVRV